MAEPLEVVVRKDFFLDLKLPSFAVRGEQLEVKVVVYNYSPDPDFVSPGDSHRPPLLPVWNHYKIKPQNDRRERFKGSVIFPRFFSIFWSKTICAAQLSNAGSIGRWSKSDEEPRFLCPSLLFQ